MELSIEQILALPSINRNSLEDGLTIGGTNIENVAMGDGTNTETIHPGTYQNDSSEQATAPARQGNARAIITRIKNAGWPDAVALAAVANAYDQSDLNNHAHRERDTGEKWWGLFMFEGGRLGYTDETELKTPTFQIEAVIKELESNGGALMRAYDQDASLANLTLFFARDIDRTLGSQGREKSAYDVFGQAIANTPGRQINITGAGDTDYQTSDFSDADHSDVAPARGDRDGFFSFGGDALEPAWISPIRNNAVIIPTSQTTSTKRPLYVYDLIEFGPSGKIDPATVGMVIDNLAGDVLEDISKMADNLLDPLGEKDVREYLRTKLHIEGHSPAEFPQLVGDKWKNEPTIKMNILLNSKAAIAKALLDFMGFSKWQFQDPSYAQAYASYGRVNAATAYSEAGITLETALNFPYARVENRALTGWGYTGRIYGAAPGSEIKPWTPMLHVGEKIDESWAQWLGFGQEAPTVTENDLPCQGKYFRMTLAQFLEATGIDIGALTQGKFESSPVNEENSSAANVNAIVDAATPASDVEQAAALVSFLINPIGGVLVGGTVASANIAASALSWYLEHEDIDSAKWTGNAWDESAGTVQERIEARYRYLSHVTVKDVLAFNYFYLNEGAAQRAFNPAEERRVAMQVIEDAGTEEEREAARKAYEELIKSQKEKCIAVGDQSWFDRETASIEDLIFSEKCILASNLSFLHSANNWRLMRTKKYDRVEMCTGSPTEFISKLYMQKGFVEFAHYTTNLQLSHLIPLYKFYKVIYDAAGCPANEIEISFPKKTDFKAMLHTQGRGQVGVRNIEWAFISNNPSTVRNDITAKVTLFFQNFNALTEERGSGENTWRYLDLLRRPPKDLEKILKAQASAQKVTQVGAGAKDNCSSTHSAPTSIDPSQTSGTGNNPAPGELESSDSETEMTLHSSQPGSEFYEIKMVVGWSPPQTKIPGSSGSLVREGTKNNATPLFLTLIDHEFDIGQDGVFELTLSFRARIEGLLSDGRANVLSTPANKAIREGIDKEMEIAKAKCDEEGIKRIKEDIALQKTNQKAWLGDALLSSMLQGNGDWSGKTQVYTAVVGQHDIVDAQFHTEDIPLTYENTNIVGPMAGSDVGFEALGELGDGKDAMLVVVGNLMKDVYGNQHVSDPQSKSRTGRTAASVKNSQAYTATQNAATKSKEERNAALEEHANEYDPEDDVVAEDNAYWASWANMGSFDTRFGRLRLGGPIYDEIYPGFMAKGLRGIADLDEWINNPDKFAHNSYAGKQSDYYPIHFLFAGDLINNAAAHALDYSGTSPTVNRVAFTPCAMSNVKVLLGPISLVTKTGRMYNVNIGDIPIALSSFQAWFKRNITDQDKDGYPLLTFIRDIIQEALVDVLKADCFQGTIQQQINLKTGIVSIPMSETGKSPVEVRIDKIGTVPDARTDGTETLADPGSGGWKYSETAFANQLDLSAITPANPLYQGDVWAKSDEMFHYLYIYGESQAGAPDMKGDFVEDFNRGIYHMLMGAEKGLVKSINFSKTDQPYLREARFEADALNPLAELSAVYKANVKLVGNTMFYPGQYVFINMQPIGRDLGHPATDKTPANQLGLGGYHLITKVTNEITSDNQFETNIDCLWDNSGDGKSRLSAGAQTTVDKCPEDKTDGMGVPPGTENVPGGKTLEEE